MFRSVLVAVMNMSAEANPMQMKLKKTTRQRQVLSKRLSLLLLKVYKTNAKAKQAPYK